MNGVEDRRTLRAALVEFAPEVLGQLLGLPEGAIIDAIWTPHDRPGVLMVRLRGAGFPVAQGCVIPTTRPIVTDHPDGTRTIDWRLPDGEPAQIAGKRPQRSKRWERDDQATQDLIELGSDKLATLSVIAQWTDEQCREAESWANLRHLRASDNAVRVPPMPAHVAALPERAAAVAESYGYVTHGG